MAFLMVFSMVSRGKVSWFLELPVSKCQDLGWHLWIKLPQSCFHVLVSEAVDYRVEESRDDIVEQSQFLVPLWGGVGPRVHVHKHGRSTEHGDHSDVGCTGGEGFQSPLC